MAYPLEDDLPLDEAGIDSMLYGLKDKNCLNEKTYKKSCKFNAA